MEKLENWLNQEVPLKKLWLYILGALALSLISDIFWDKVLQALFSFGGLKLSGPPDRETVSILSWWFPLMLILKAWEEEMLFRWLPLYLTVKADKPFQEKMLMAIVFSLIFGLVHGSVLSILFQGISGFIWSLLWFKCGGLQGHYIKATAVTTLTHALWNGGIAIVLLARGIIRW